MVLDKNMIPPPINYEEPDRPVFLTTSNKAREAMVDYVMSNSLALAAKTPPAVQAGVSMKIASVQTTVDWN